MKRAKILLAIILLVLILMAMISCGGDAENGKSAYEIAVENGFVGSEAEWLESINGVGIESVTIDYMGKVVITLTDGSVHEIAVTDTSCTHDYDVQVAGPTCAEEGYTKFTCKNCEFSYVNEKRPATGHHFYERYCVFCNAEESFGEIEYDTSWYESARYEFEIDTKEELAGLAYLVNTGVDNFATKTVLMTGHIDLISAEWTPIGTEEHPFAGVFNGRGLTISNLKLNKECSYVGLFGYSLGEIKNIVISGASISVSGYNEYVGIACGFNTKAMEGVSVAGYIDAADCDFVGGVVGRINDGVKNSSNAAEIKGNNYVAGIAGWVNIGGSYEFTELYNSGNISGDDQVAGIIGRLYANTNTNANYTLKINNSSNSGNIMSNSHAGGIIAWADTTNSHSSGVTTVIADVLNNTGDISGGWKAGGIFGTMNCELGSYLTNSTSSANIKAYSYVGGLVGETYALAISECSNKGSTVTCLKYIESYGDVYAFLGGYVGYGYKVHNCLNDVDITYNDVGKAVGGIAGAACGEITFCTNNGDIKSNGDVVGGIVGLLSAMNEWRIYTFNDLNNNGNISGSNSIGGIVGHLERGCEFRNASINIVKFNNITNTGVVAGGWNIGGIIGWGKTYDPYSSYYEGNLHGTNFTNSGNISSNYGNVGEFFGYFHSDKKNSWVKVYSALGQITLNGETLVGNYLVGTNDGITITQ